MRYQLKDYSLLEDSKSLATKTTGRHNASPGFSRYEPVLNEDVHTSYLPPTTEELQLPRSLLVDDDFSLPYQLQPKSADRDLWTSLDLFGPTDEHGGEALNMAIPRYSSEPPSKNESAAAREQALSNGGAHREVDIQDYEINDQPNKSAHTKDGRDGEHMEFKPLLSASFHTDRDKLLGMEEIGQDALKHESIDEGLSEHTGLFDDYPWERRSSV